MSKPTARRARRPDRAPAAAPGTGPEFDEASDSDLSYDLVNAVFSVAATRRGHARREAILKAATTEFLEKGFQAASLRNITRMAGGSSESIYKYFGDKAGLFISVIARQRMDNIPFVADPKGGPIEDELKEIALVYLRTMLAPERLALYRMMVGESSMVPEISRMIWDYGPGEFVSELAAYLDKLARAGRIRVEDTELAALQFLELARANLHLRALFGDAKVTSAQVEKQAKAAVEIFVRGVGTKLS